MRAGRRWLSDLDAAEAGHEALIFDAIEVAATILPGELWEIAQELRAKENRRCEGSHRLRHDGIGTERLDDRVSVAVLQNVLLEIEETHVVHADELLDSPVDLPVETLPRPRLGERDGVFDPDVDLQ